jgi:general secretion pathway protein B
MSYILDALRRAQAERERAQVPGLDAGTPLAGPAPLTRRRAGLLGLGAGLALAALGLAAGLLLRTDPQPPPGAAPVVVPLPRAMPAAPPAVAAASAPPGLAPPVMVVVTAPVAGVGGGVGVGVGVRAVTLAQLGADLRRELPPLALGGAIWSDNAASRFLIVNGQVLREGDTAAPGVVLERIGPKAAFLRWRDWRIEVPL